MNETLKLKKATYHLYTFFISKMVGALGQTVYGFGMSLYILSMTGSALSFASNMLSSIIPRIILAPLSGAISDRVPRKILVIGGQIGQILVLIGLLLYTLTFGLTVPAIYITTASFTMFNTFSSIAFSASIPNLVDSDRLQKAMSFNQLSSSIAGIAGPIIGGMLFGFASMYVFLLINIVALSITTVLESTMNFRLYVKEVVKIEKESIVESMKHGLAYVKNHLLIKRLLIMMLWINLFFTAFGVGVGFVLLEKLKLRPDHIGWIEGAIAVGMLLSSLYFASRGAVKNPISFTKRGILCTSILIGLVALPLLVPMHYWLMFAFFMVLSFTLGCSIVCTNMPLMVLFQSRVEEAFRGRVFGLIDMAAMSLMPLGTLVYGILYDLVPAEIILICTSLILICVTFQTLTQKVVDAERGTSPETTTAKNDAVLTEATTTTA